MCPCVGQLYFFECRAFSVRSFQIFFIETIMKNHGSSWKGKVIVASGVDPVTNWDTDPLFCLDFLCSRNIPERD